MARDINSGNMDPYHVNAGHYFNNQLNAGVSSENDVDFGISEDHDDDEAPELQDRSITLDAFHSDSDDDSDYQMDVDDSDDDSMHCDDFENLPSLFLQNKLRYEQMKHTLNEHTFAPDRFVYDNDISATATCLAQMLLVIERHGGTKSLFDEIVKIIFEWVKEVPDIFSTSAGPSQEWDRDKLVRTLTKVFKAENLKPQHPTVTLTDGRLATLSCFDFPSLVRDLLDHPKSKEWIADGIDPYTFEPKYDNAKHQRDPDAIIFEKHTGSNYMNGVKLHCKEDRVKTYVLPLGIVINSDATHADRNGGLKMTPCQFSLSVFSVKALEDEAAWRMYAALPNLSLGLGKDGKKRNQGYNNMRDYHLLMKKALKSFMKSYEDGGIPWINWDGHEVILKPFLERSLADLLGHNENCGHKPTCNTKFVNRNCLCESHELTSVPTKCSMLTQAEIDACCSDKEVFQKMQERRIVSYYELSKCMYDSAFADATSKYPIKNAFYNIPTSDLHRGIYGISAQDVLHLLGGGNYKYIILAHKDVIGPKDKNSRAKGIVNALFADVRHYLGRNADRDIKRMSNRNGFFNVTNIQCDEVCGNYFGFVVFLHTTYGRSLLQPCYTSRGIDYSEMLETNLLLLSWQQFLSQPNKRHMIEASEVATQRLMKRLQQHIPREERKREGKQEGSKGWKILKHHVTASMADQTLAMGSTKGTDTAINERNHMKMVKQHVNKTQRIGRRFTMQVAELEFERQLMSRVGNHIRAHIPSAIRHIGYPSVTRSASQEDYQYVEYSDSEFEDDDSASSGSNDSDTDDQTDDDVSVASSTEEESDVEGRVCVGDLRGAYDTVIKIDARGRRVVRTNWRWEKKNKDAVKTNEIMEVAIANLHVKYCKSLGVSTTTTIRGTCYTSAVIDGTVYRSTSNFNGAPWFDWAHIRFPETIDSEGNVDCAGRILGFFQYEDKQAMTFQRIEVNGDDLEKIEEYDAPDDRLYMILHCSTNDMTLKTLRKHFILPFEVTSLNNVYVLPVDCIRRPLLVIPDFISETERSNKRFLAICPRIMQRHYFIRYILNGDEKYNVNLDPGRFERRDENSSEEEEEDEQVTSSSSEEESSESDDDEDSHVNEDQIDYFDVEMAGEVDDYYDSDDSVAHI